MEAGVYDHLLWIKDSLYLFWPEIELTLFIVLLIVASLFKSTSRFVHYIALAGIAFYFVELFGVWPTDSTKLFGGMLSHNVFASTFKLMMGIAALLTLFITRKRQPMEYYLFIFAILLGAGLLVMSQHFVMLLLSIELVSISSYVLTAGVIAERQRAEAAWKFFIFGSASTAFMVFGMSYLYGITGTADFTSEYFLKAIYDHDPILTTIGGVMLIGGFLFKMTAAPFHLWAPDVYQVTPSPVVAFISVVPKLAGVGVIAKIILALNVYGQSQLNWPIIFTLFALLSIVVGTLAAIGQTDAKRMMAYSSVAQAGFLLIGISTFSIEGIRIIIFYSAVFLVMNYIVFAVISQFEEDGPVSFESFAGLGYSKPISALAITAGLVSLVGLPPVAGFMAKLLLFSTVWAKFQETAYVGYGMIFVAGLLATVVSLFFYLKIPFYLYFRHSEENRLIKTDVFTNLLLLILLTLLLVLFFAPGVLMGWVNKVNFVL